MSRPLRVLMVEDSERDAALVLRELRRGGYTPVFQRVDTAAAMEAALAEQAWDIIIADHAMPYFSAPAALTVMQELGLDLPFIIVSGTIGEEVAVAAMKAGAHDYLMKDQLARLSAAVERELREAAVRRERRRSAELAPRLSRILDASPHEIYVVDAATLRVAQVNQGARRSLGYAPEELERLTLRAVLTEFGDAEFAALLEPLRTGERDEVVVETVHRRKDGATYPVEVRLYLSRAESPPVVVAIAQDITERKQAESAVLTIRQAERQRIARDLHDVVLHDLVDVLQGLRVHQVQERDGALRSELAHEIDALGRAVRQLRNAIYDLQLGEAEQQPFRQSLEALVEPHRQLAPGCEIEVVVDQGFPAVLPPLVQVELLRIVQEALTNARRHAAARHIRVTAGRAGDEISVVVADDGRGFEPVLPDDGAGLRGMQQRAAALGGTLAIHSQPGQGTRITARAPLPPVAGA